MPFGIADLDDVYRETVVPAVESLGLSCVRGDDIFGVDSIMEDIWSLLCRCTLVVGEFTGRNPNVLYEAGIAHTLGKPLIAITQDVADIPFDFRHMRVIEYRSSPSGYRDLASRVKSTIETVLLAEVYGSPQPYEAAQRERQLVEALLQERRRSQELFLALEERQQLFLSHLYTVAEGKSVVRLDDDRLPKFVPVSAQDVRIAEADEAGQVEQLGFAHVEHFEIAETEITNEQYQLFVEATGHYSPDDWTGSAPRAGRAKHPVVGVSWVDCNAYCRWLETVIGGEVRLPTEAEWLAAADCAAGLVRFPWNGEWVDGMCNSAEIGSSSTTSVAHFEQNRCATGTRDMLGNVWEWTSSLFDDSSGMPWRAVRGGASYSRLSKCGLLARLVAFPGHFLFVRDLGFRPVRVAR